MWGSEGSTVLMCVVLQLVRFGDSDDGGVGGSTVLYGCGGLTACWCGDSDIGGARGVLS